MIVFFYIRYLNHFLSSSETEIFQSFLSLIAFRIKPPIIAIGIDTEKETGSRDAPRTPPKIVHIIAATIITTPPKIHIYNTFILTS